MSECAQVDNLYNQLLKTEHHHFPISGKVNVSNKQGVYIIFSLKGEVLHVGKTARGKNGLNQRLGNHLRNQSSFSKKYLIVKGIELRQQESLNI
ncbi:MAG: hypothetical protein BM564_13335 [Bacteroidetes bacterium MedPE-SWsnd-G2]|nr:MAG: hypothetical protein BM564_13335 [Bacteroidetes bacterium MedPE-SWsnd-G2]